MTIATMELRTVMLSTSAEWHLDDVTQKSVNSELLVVTVTTMTSLVPEHGKQCISCSAIFSSTLQTDSFSAEISAFRKQIITLKSFNSAL